jgi:hypothetical protein
MRLRHEFSIFAITAFALSGAAFASAPSAATVISDDNIPYLAPLLEGCSPGDRHCGIVKDKYMVTLREGYLPSSHLSYVFKNLDIDPVKDWKIRWIGDDVYTANNVSAESVYALRRDPGVEEIEQGYWFEMVEVDMCRNPSLSEEERRICHEEEDLPQCERPSLSLEKRLDCFATIKLLSCFKPEFSEEELQSCQEASHDDPCENSELSKEQQRFCRDGSSFAALVHGGSDDL